MASETNPPLAPSDRELLKRCRDRLAKHGPVADLIIDINARLAADEDAEYEREAEAIVKEIGWDISIGLGVSPKVAIETLARELKARDQRRKEQTDGR